MEQARNACYVEDTHCVAHPTLGGMGYHWGQQRAGRSGLPTRASRGFLLYSPDQQGSPKLAAVEYIVIDVGQPAPKFRGYPFDVGGTPVPVPHWSLHVWLHRANPSGVFKPFNPAVVCPN